MAEKIQLSQHFLGSGYFIGREFWNKNNIGLKFDDATWILFKSGFSSIVHKQVDDNSFILYSRGCDIFVDCGMYNYMYRDPIRQYLRSTNAHNTVIVNEKSFEFLRKELIGRSGIAYSYINEAEDIGYVIGYNYLYHSVYMIRHLIFAGNKLFILDEIRSNHINKYTQLFHMGKSVKITYL